MNQDQFAEAKTASVDALFGLAGQTFEGVEKLTALNLQMFKTSLAELEETAGTVLAAKGPEELISLQANLAQAAPQKLAAYGNQVKEIITSATAQQSADIQAQFADIQAKFIEGVSGALKNVPGSENTVSLMKSAVEAATNAYEGANKASQQLNNVVDANITKFTETTAKTTRAARAKSEA